LNLKNPCDTKEINLLSLISEEEELDPQMIKLNACEPISLVETGWSTQVDAKTIKKLGNHLQLTIDTTAGIYDLNLAKPGLLEKMDKMNELYCEEKFIEAGFKLFSWQKNAMGKKYAESLSLSPMRNLIIQGHGDKDQSIFK